VSNCVFTPRSLFTYLFGTRSYKAVQSCDEGVTSGEALAALDQNSTYMHNVLGPACIFLRKGFAESRQAVLGLVTQRSRV
uniref:Uncharacterized protein n=1 Tax=Sinocyclocheilus anshuiensis TaxID=1608454 RepID=A0A671KU40_9TELE